ncbi:MAG: PorV/PorQ family protein [Candidatus Edwardsbacteria bacterium]
MFKTIRALSMLISLLFISYSWCIAGSGTAGNQFLKLPVGARPTAMGGAFVGLADDANSIFWNPAGLNQSNNQECISTYTRLYGEINLGNFTFALPVLRGRGGFGLSYLDVSDIRRNEIGEELGEFTNRNFLLVAAYAISAKEGLSIGGTAGFVHSTLENEKSSSLTCNLGLLHKPIEKFSVGVSMLNLGLGSKFIEKRDPAPLEFKVGGAGKLVLYERELHLVSDISFGSDFKPNLAGGGEFIFNFSEISSNLAVRAGYHTRYGWGSLSGFCFGLGFERKLNRFNLSIDVTHSFSELGGSEKGSVGIKF